MDYKRLDVMPSKLEQTFTVILNGEPVKITVGPTAHTQIHGIEIAYVPVSPARPTPGPSTESTPRSS